MIPPPLWLPCNQFRLLDYTGSVDILSPTFTDLQVRYHSDQSKIAVSATTSSAGTLGFVIALDDNILKSKIFYQTQVGTGEIKQCAFVSTITDGVQSTLVMLHSHRI